MPTPRRRNGCVSATQSAATVERAPSPATRSSPMTSMPRMAIAPCDRGPTATLQVVGDAFKNTGSGSWLIPSDARLKEDVRELEAGLAQLRRVRPVRFRYNGRAGTPAGQEGVGVLGQEIEKIFPEMIRQVPGEPGLQDLRIYDGSALTFVLVNAVKEQAGKVEQLEQTLAEARKERESDG